jgi:uncharacterized protein YukE
MKRIAGVWWLAFFLLGAASLFLSAQTSTQTDQQPLGDYARAQKNGRKKAVKTIDNDNLPMEDKINVVGTPPAGAGDAQNSQAPAQDQAEDGETQGKPPAPGKQPAKSEKMPDVTPGESAEERQKVYDKWQEKLTEQQQKLDMVTKELDIQQREFKLQVADFYADAGNRLRNQADWDKKDADFKKQIEEKQKAIDQAKQDLEDMQEDARKAGVPNSVAEKATSENAQN